MLPSPFTQNKFRPKNHKNVIFTFFTPKIIICLLNNFSVPKIQFVSLLEMIFYLFTQIQKIIHFKHISLLEMVFKTPFLRGSHADLILMCNYTLYICKISFSCFVCLVAVFTVNFLPFHSKDRQTDRQTNEQTDGPTDIWTDGQTASVIFPMMDRLR